ncbi:hypothetical protein [Photorhabdus khanii]|uniref:Uncharacterized protein n=1 Tax=Photorhabdus khanii subsp. guanajuatensis TaxID=2100166 RepID=A0A4R4J664_9GAMM|nr:hypothetical protein [Photorhabdus khanii]TDB48189.1 hypothetical protein C5467_19720 [Photorhabdus khanii subsp. guanajuatensis]
MIEFTQAQIDKFNKLEKDEFIEKMKNQILSEHADLVPEHESLSHRLKAAYDYLLELNFQEQNVLQSYLYLVAFNPDFQYASSIKSALESPGQKPEQQFKDCLRIAKNKMNRRR